MCLVSVKGKAQALNQFSLTITFSYHLLEAFPRGRTVLVINAYNIVDRPVNLLLATHRNFDTRLAQKAPDMPKVAGHRMSPPKVRSSSTADLNGPQRF